MKNFRKYMLFAVIAALFPVCANAEVSVKDTISPEFIHNSGYSDEVSRIIKVRTKDPATPIPAETQTKKEKFGWWLLDTINPNVNRPGKIVDHNINYGDNIDCL